MMKATDGPVVANLVALLIKKLDSRQDNTPLGHLVASHVAQVVGDARTRDCPDDEAVRKTVDALDDALRLWQQYESSRSR